jgi:hypothetical protein
MKNSDELRLFPLSKDEIIQKFVLKYSLPEYANNYISQILEGKRSENSLICCNGGCDVCNDTILNCLTDIKKELEPKDAL